MPLSANLLKLESSILTQAKRATNRNNIATKKCKQKKNHFFIFIFSRGGFWSGGFCRVDFILEPLTSSKFLRRSSKLIMTDTSECHSYLQSICEVATLRKLLFHFLLNRMGYNCGDSFPFYFLNQMEFYLV